MRVCVCLQAHEILLGCMQFVQDMCQSPYRLPPSPEGKLLSHLFPEPTAYPNCRRFCTCAY